MQEAAAWIYLLCLPSTVSTWDILSVYMYIDGLVQERHNSSALAMELSLSCINPLICSSFSVFHRELNIELNLMNMQPL